MGISWIPIYSNGLCAAAYSPWATAGVQGRNPVPDIHPGSNSRNNRVWRNVDDMDMNIVVIIRFNEEYLAKFIILRPATYIMLVIL